MAEAFLRHIWGDQFDVYSAGIEKHGLNPLAVRVMREVGIDISRHESKSLDDLGALAFDYVITVCGHANESCPVFPGETIRLHEGFDDPPKLADNAGSEEEALTHYRRVRDEIEQYARILPGEIDE
jgi:arsenate reductase